ncbi:MAG: hypothetical protein OYK82_11250 [Gammaproteobacteria bacterium]|nr:hypothetical protein [Gammaproteobacteria bacterium]
MDARIDAFAPKAEDIASSQTPEDRRIGRLRGLDPPERLLELKVCDPAMGSGHLLVNLVDCLGPIEFLVSADDRDDPDGAEARRRSASASQRYPWASAHVPSAVSVSCPGSA